MVRTPAVSRPRRSRPPPPHNPQGRIRHDRTRRAPRCRPPRSWPTLALRPRRSVTLAARKSRGIVGRFTTMSVKLRPYRRGGREVDIQLALPDGLTKIRERRKAAVSGRTAAQRWGEAREAQLLRDALTRPKSETPAKEVPTLKTFAPRFIEGYAKANRQKASGIDSKESILRIHLMPRFGHKKLCDISDEDIQRLK